VGKFLLVVVLVGVAVYLIVRIIERRGIKPTPKAAPRPLGPDDDPDFLWNLNKKTRHQKKPPPPPTEPDTDDEPGDEAKPA
jgi:hypothetical protein